MRAKTNRFIFIILAISLLSFIACKTTQPQETGTTSQYHIKAHKLDLEAVDSYPQEIIKIYSQESVYDLEIQTGPGTDIIKPVPYKQYEYPETIARYLEPSTKVESDNEKITGLAAEITKNETDIIEIMQKVAAWTAKNISYDNELAEKIWGGLVDTQGALDTLERRKGTCSEYTNLFIALMRALGIPSRFISGKISDGVYHAWAEVYVYETNWIPVDPQMGTVGITYKHIKLFYGTDFVDIGVKLKEINVSVFPVYKEKEIESIITFLPDDIFVLCNHDNKQKSGVSPWGDGTHVPRVAVNFIYSDCPVTLIGIDFFAANMTGSKKNFNLFCCYNKGGLPEIDEPLYTLDNQEVPVTSGEWISISLPGIEINEPSFWIVIEWLTKPLSPERGQNSFFLGTDKNLDYPLRNLFHYDNWQNAPTVIGDFLVNTKLKKL